MHSRVSNKQQPRACKGKLRNQRRKYKRNNEGSYKLVKKKFNGTAKISYLKEIIEQLVAEYLQLQVPATDRRKQEISVSQSASQSFDPNFDVKDEQSMDSHLEGTPEELDGLELDDLLDDLLPDEVTNPKNSVTMQRNMAEFFMKFDDDVASNVDYPDFMICLDEEQKTVGRYSFPLSLVPTVEKIINVYGDVSAPSSMNTHVAGKIYLFFCATIKEMDDLELHQVTEEKMLKWRDAIKDALRINFKVEFAMSHLKRIARAYFGRKGKQVLQTIGEKLEAMHKERDEAFDGFKDYLPDAMDFDSKSVSTGLFS